MLRKKTHCFGCGRTERSPKSNVISGHKVYEWTCKECLFDNCVLENGTPFDRPLSHTNLDTPSTRFTIPSKLPEKTTPVFCNECLHNQQLQITLLAAHIPADDAPDFEERYACAEEYRRRLEQHYPSVCEKCLPHVEQRLEQHMRKGQDYALKTIVSRRRTVENDQDTIISQNQLLSLRILIVFRVFLDFLFIVYLVIAYIRPEITLHFQSATLYAFVGSILTLPFRVHTEPGTRVVGKISHLLLYFVAYLCRLLIVYEIQTLHHSDTRYRQVIATGAVIWITLLVFAKMTLKISRTRTINLVGTVQSLSPSRNSNYFDMMKNDIREQPYPMSLPKINQPITHINNNEYSIENIRRNRQPNSNDVSETEQMDWVPATSAPLNVNNLSPFSRTSNDPHILTNSSGKLSFGFSTSKPNYFKNRKEYSFAERQNTKSDPNFGSQSFFGYEKSTGLEDFFNQALEITDDSNLLQRTRRVLQVAYGPHRRVSRLLTILSALLYLTSERISVISVSLPQSAKQILHYGIPVVGVVAIFRLFSYRFQLFSALSFHNPKASRQRMEQTYRAKQTQIRLCTFLICLLISRLAMFAFMEMGWDRIRNSELETFLDKLGNDFDFMTFFRDKDLKNITNILGYGFDLLTLFLAIFVWKCPSDNH